MLKRRLMAIVAALAACLSVGVVAPASAHAALGSYLYYTTSWYHFDDPANIVCHSLNGTAVVIHNNTNTPAVIYQDFDCMVPVGVAAVGAEFALPSGSVRFVGA